MSDASTKLEARVGAIVDGLRRRHAPAFADRYHDKFVASGVEKGKAIIERLRADHPDLALGRFAYLCVGGSDGAEIETVMQNTEIRFGILLEYEPAVIPSLSERVIPRRNTEQINHNLLFRWFVVLPTDAEVRHPTVFTHKRILAAVKRGKEKLESIH